jgi:hypothetical protein
MPTSDRGGVERSATDGFGSECVVPEVLECGMSVRLLCLLVVARAGCGCVTMSLSPSLSGRRLPTTLSPLILGAQSLNLSGPRFDILYWSISRCLTSRASAWEQRNSIDCRKLSIS